MEEFKISAPDGKSIHAYSWSIDEPVGHVQILHGIAEYGGRYQRLGEFLNANGYSAFAHDHRGHGKTLSPEDTPLFVADRNGERQLIEDARLVARHFRESNPSLPLYLLGHSMGSLITSGVMQRYPDHADGLFLSALPEIRPALNYLGQGFAAAQIGLRGGKSTARLHERLSFGTFNRKFKPNRTTHDWISSLDHEVDDYVNDPMCGGQVSIQLFRDLMDLLQHAHDTSRWTSAHRGLQVFAFAGGDDPVAGMELGFLKSMDRFKRALPKLEFRIFEKSRHEVLWDRESEVVMGAILSELERWQLRLDRA